MYKFILRSLIFTIILSVLGEVIIRVYKLTPDIPQRYIDDTGIQRYKPGQKGYYAKSDTKWNVNEFGWLGLAETNYDITIAIIGDSYIENIMNDISCNQGAILKSYFKDIGFFEAGRSGVSFIEAMEITKILKSIVKPKFYLLYVSSNDFYESLSNRTRYLDRVQIDLNRNKILKAKLKHPELKRILYSSKLLYYLYLRFPLFVSNQNKDKIVKSSLNRKEFDIKRFNKLFEFCTKNYECKNIVLVFHPGTEKEIISLAKEREFRIIELNSDKDKKWGLGEHDGHWSCYGHQQVAKQVKIFLEKELER